MAAASDATAVPAPRRRRRKPTAQSVLFRNVCTTSVIVPRETNTLVARFQDVLRSLEPELSTRPNVATTAGWLLREGFRFAARNRVHGLGVNEAAPTDETVQLYIHTERSTWAEIQRWVVAEETTLATVVPRLIELGAEQHPVL
jgi:hypothetical protein